MQTAFSKGEMPPDKLIHYKSCLLQENSLGLLPPPQQLALHKKPSCQCTCSIWKLRFTGMTRVDVSQTKSLMTYFTVGLAFYPDFFCVLLGVPLTLWDDCKSLPLKNKWHHLAAQLHCHIDPLIHEHFLFSARYLWLMTLLKKRNYPQIPHGKKKQESLIIYTASWPVVLYLVTWLHREHSVSVWLVAVMR